MHFLCLFRRGMLAQPGAQRHILLRGRVEAVAVDTPAEHLAADRIARLPEALYRRIVLGADPAVAVTVEQHLASNIRPVGAGSVPEASVEEDGSARLREHRDCAFWLADGIRR